MVKYTQIEKGGQVFLTKSVDTDPPKMFGCSAPAGTNPALLRAAVDMLSKED